MNRAQRRKQGIKKPVNYNRQQLERIKKDTALEAADFAFRFMILIPFYTMRNHYKWGQKRLDEFLDAVLETYSDFTDERFDLRDLAKTLEEETGISFKGKIEEHERTRQKKMEESYAEWKKL